MFRVKTWTKKKITFGIKIVIIVTIMSIMVLMDIVDLIDKVRGKHKTKTQKIDRRKQNS